MHVYNYCIVYNAINHEIALRGSKKKVTTERKKDEIDSINKCRIFIVRNYLRYEFGDSWMHFMHRLDAYTVVYVQMKDGIGCDTLHVTHVCSNPGWNQRYARTHMHKRALVFALHLCPLAHAPNLRVHFTLDSSVACISRSADDKTNVESIRRKQYTFTNQSEWINCIT